MASDFVRWNERKVDPATGMDIAFLDGPHRNNPRRMYSQTGADWQMRVDFDRLRKDRLKKLQAEMKVDNLGALDLVLAPKHLARLDAVSRIELGFPHDFLGSAPMKQFVFGQTWDRLDLPARLVGVTP